MQPTCKDSREDKVRSSSTHPLPRRPARGPLATCSKVSSATTCFASAGVPGWAGSETPAACATAPTSCSVSLSSPSAPDNLWHQRHGGLHGDAMGASQGWHPPCLCSLSLRHALSVLQSCPSYGCSSAYSYPVHQTAYSVPDNESKMSCFLSHCDCQVQQ